MNTRSKPRSPRKSKRKKTEDNLSTIGPVLLVEDSLTQAGYFRGMLESAGFRVAPASRLDQALTLLTKRPPAVVILDLTLPDSEPANTLARVLEKTGDIPVVVLTCLADEDMALDALKKGAEDYLIKEGLTSSMFVRSVRYALARKHADKLETLVEARTAELAEINKRLQADIAERKRTEDELELFSHAVGSSIDALAMGDLDDKITYANESFVKMFGYSREELIGEDIALIYPEDQIPKLQEAVKAAMEGSWTGELVAKKKDGKRFPILVSASRVLDDQGKVITHIASHRDITQLKQQQQQHQVKAQLLDELRGCKTVDECLQFCCRAIRDAGLFERAVLTRYGERREITDIGHVGVDPKLLKRVRKARPPDESLYGKIEHREFGISHSFFIPEEAGISFKETGRHIPQEPRQATGDASWRQGDELFVPFISKDGTTDGYLSVDTPVNGKRPDKQTILYLEDIVDIAARQIHEIENFASLSKSEQKFRTFIETATDLIDIADKDGKFIYVNKSMVEALGYSREELIGMSIADIMSKESAEEFLTLECRNKLIAKGEIGFEPVWIAKDGTEIQGEIRAVAIYDDDGEFIGSKGIFRDITERKRAEERFRLTAEVTTDLIYEWDIRTDSLEWFGGFDEALGYEPGEVPRTIDAWAKLIHPDDLKRLGDSVERHRRTTKPILEEYRVQKKDGTWACWLDRGAPILDEDGMPVKWIGGCSDITERKRAEDELIFQSMLLNHISDRITATDLEGRITYVNNAELVSVKRSRDQLVGRMVYEYGEDSRRGATQQEIIDKTLADGSWTGEVVNYASDGSEVLYECRTALVRDGNGKPTGMIGISTDITERKHAEEERRSLERQMQYAQKLESLGVLAGGIAHDFNNLLMAVMGNADLALKKLSPVAPARNNIDEITKASQRAADLCQQMLAYSGRGRFVIENLDLSELVKEMGHMLEVSISKKAFLSYDLADNLPPIEADATQIRQVVMNLITNASEAIGDISGVVSISTGAMQCDQAYLTESHLDEKLPAGLYTYIEVADTGAGMDKEMQAKLFDPFFTTKFTGRGLGLAAVLGIVRGHKGAIKVYSEPGKGTTFKVLFPACAESAEDHGQSRGRGTGWTTDHRQKSEWQGSGTVLLVDDIETVRAVGQAMLEDFGFTVLAARDGREALDVYREHADEIACVILDLTMPKMDGEECFREMRRTRKDVRVIMSSGYNELDVTQRFAGKGLAGFIQKPYLMGELEAKLREVLASS